MERRERFKQDIGSIVFEEIKDVIPEEPEQEGGDYTSKIFTYLQLKLTSFRDQVSQQNAGLRSLDDQLSTLRRGLRKMRDGGPEQSVQSEARYGEGDIKEAMLGE